MKIQFDLSLFANSKARIGIEPKGLTRKKSEKALLWLLEALVNINRMELRRNTIPPLYRAGVRYQREESTEIWQDCVNIYKNGQGDCEDLACWRIAELRNNNKKASPYIRYRVDPDSGMFIYHVLVMRASGKLEDPSFKLGMR